MIKKYGWVLFLLLWSIFASSHFEHYLLAGAAGGFVIGMIQALVVNNL